MKNRQVAVILTGAMLLISAGYSGLSLAHGDETHVVEKAQFIGVDSAAGQLVKQFHNALQTGNETIVRLSLAENVQIYEGGKVERSLVEYASHHLHADMAYLKGLTVTLKEHQVSITGDIAISTAISHSQGEYKGKVVDSINMETLVLTKQGDGSWKITHVHWS
ncbi:YybH family protein [Shewanella sp. OMA3-2]|uniref:YybH family protein n=1 Tax=Shewanella sp. OMA3-2 TaxID=2908650 RepID=UPI001F3D85A6|nr:nuclear transport factor 2 family protein [Shewanella sp. OMA3-2]UJF20875.1 nuclear transport factor 2 family protein [Shewanella sp. OMA3-2]